MTYVIYIYIYRPPSEKVTYVLNGDIADRGDNSLEIFVIVLLYKVYVLLMCC